MPQSKNEFDKLVENMKDKISKSFVSDEISFLVKMTADQCKKLCDSIQVKYNPGYENRVIERITSTEAVDRDGDIVRYKGIDNIQYRKNPVVMFAHERGDFPIGNSLKEWLDNKIKGCRSWDLHYDNEIDTSGKSDRIFRMTNAGILKAASIGFQPLEYKWDFSDDEREALGLGKYGVEYLKILKLEHSVCAIGANQEALIGRSKNIEILHFTKEDLDAIEKDEIIDNELIDNIAHTIGVKKTVSLPAKKEEETMNTFNINIDTEKINEACKGLNDQITTMKIDLEKQVENFNKTINDIELSFKSRFDKLITITEMALSSIEQKSISTDLYDKKEIEDLLKI